MSWFKKKGPAKVVATESEESNHVTSLPGKRDEWRGLHKKYIYFVLLFIAAVSVVAVVLGLGEDQQQAEEREARAAADFRDSTAVAGDHLMGIPKDYKEQADQEAQLKADAEKERRRAEAEKAAAEKKAKPEVPAAPQVPAQPARPAYYGPSGSGYQSPAEKAEELRLERRRKALESPIGFELKEDK